MGRNDLIPNLLSDISWETGQLATPLEEMRQYVATKGRETVEWYFRRCCKHRTIGRTFRVSAILLTAFAGLLPLINDIHQSQRIQAELTAVSDPNAGGAVSVVDHSTLYRSLINPVWSAVALALVATLLALDRFYGATSGWVRFMLTAQQLTEALDDFQVAFEAQRLEWGRSEPTPEQAQAAVLAIQTYLQQINRAVHEETKAWATEFAKVLQQLDAQTKLTGPPQPQAALQITVKNADKCQEPWTLSVGTRILKDRVGKEVSVKVVPDLYIIRAAGRIADKPVQAEKAVKVTEGDILKVDLTLA